MLCEMDECVAVAVAFVKDEEDETAYCQKCLAEVVGIRKCEVPSCLNEGYLKITIAWDDESRSVGSHYFCSEQCAEKLITGTGERAVDYAISQILEGK
jgi:hypothetical protein